MPGSKTDQKSSSLLKKTMKWPLTRRSSSSFSPQQSLTSSPSPNSPQSFPSPSPEYSQDRALIKSSTVGCLLPSSISADGLRPSSSCGTRESTKQSPANGDPALKRGKLGFMKKLTRSRTQAPTLPCYSKNSSLSVLDSDFPFQSPTENLQAKCMPRHAIPSAENTPCNASTLTAAPSAPLAPLEPLGIRRSFSHNCLNTCTKDKSQGKEMQEEALEESFIFTVQPPLNRMPSSHSSLDLTRVERDMSFPRRPSCTDLRLQAMLRSFPSASCASDYDCPDSLPPVLHSSNPASKSSSPAVSQSFSSTTVSSSCSSQSDERCQVSALQRFTEAELRECTKGWGRVIGKGSFGTVFKGRVGGADVAVKRLEEDKNAGIKQGAREYSTEVLLLSCISHPNIVKLVGHCIESKCLVYEYIPGGNLCDRLAAPEKLPWKLRERILLQVASALAHIHTLPSPVVHRDLKPENILLDSDGTAKLGDVGLARIIEGDGEITYTVCGTAGYVDPESMTTFVISPLADVYAFGLILLQLLTGQGKVTRVHRILDQGDVVVRNQKRALEMAKSRILPHVDACCRESIPNSTIEGLIELGLMCSQRRRIDRPDITFVSGRLSELLRSSSKEGQHWHDLSSLET